MEEITALRTETGKIYELDKDKKSGASCYQLEARTGPIHFKESYKDSDSWQNLDETYSEKSEIKGIGKVLVYPKLPNITTVFQDICGYQIQSRSNPNHIAKVELVSIDGLPVTAWQTTKALNTYARVHPYRVGIWKDFSGAERAKSTAMRWKVTEQGNADKDSHPFFFHESPAAFTTADLINVDQETVKMSIETARTRIDDSSWYWDELIPAEAKLVDTDFISGTDYDDGYWTDGGSFARADDYCHFGDYGGVNYHSFFRFPNITVPVGTTLDSATMSFYANTTRTGTTCNIICYFNDIDTAVAPTNATEAAALTLTTASLAWNNVPSWSSGNWYTSSSIVSVVQEVIDRVGWSSGNAIMALWKDNGSSNNAYRTPSTYDKGASYAPKLSLTWTVPGSPFYYYSMMR